MMNPSTYKKIAVASTFSPRFEQVLSEAGRIRERFGSDLSLIYIGERNDETAKKFQNILGGLQLPSDSPVHYGEGDPADGILRAIADNDVDLLVAGALEKRSALHSRQYRICRIRFHQICGSRFAGGACPQK